MRPMYLYIIASRSRTLYVGITNNIHRRIHQHRTGQGGFSSRYRICRLVYVETVDGGRRAALRRERQIKGWLRAKKVALIVKDNPAWNDLASEWGAPDCWGRGAIPRERSDRRIHS